MSKQTLLVSIFLGAGIGLVMPAFTAGVSLIILGALFSSDAGAPFTDETFFNIVKGGAVFGAGLAPLLTYTVLKEIKANASIALAALIALVLAVASLLPVFHLIDRLSVSL